MAQVALPRLRAGLGLGQKYRKISRLVGRRMNFHDRRSRKLVFVPHCALNQNARVAGAAVRVAALDDLVAGLLGRGIGIVQMPCPEFEVLGLNRAHLPTREELEKDAGRAWLRNMALNCIRQVEAYQQCGITVLAILGKNGSPTCGVAMTWRDGVVPGSGVFIEELQIGLRERALQIPVLGIEDADPAAVLKGLAKAI
jgi:predicted secreted protein